MSPRTYWNDYVEKCGGLQEAADRLQTPYSTIACICNGSRGVGRALAKRFVAADSSLDENVLIWIEPKSSEAA